MKYQYKKGKFIKNGHTMLEEDVLTDLKRLAYLEEERTKQLSIADVSDIFPPLNTVKQEIDRYSETMQNNKGHFQNGINWAFNYVAKKVNK